MFHRPITFVKEACYTQLSGNHGDGSVLGRMARQIIHKELRQLVKEIEELGFTVRRDNGKHLKVYTNEGTTFVYSLPSTPGRGRWRQNLLSELRKRIAEH